MVLKKKKTLRVSNEEIEFLGEIYERMKKDEKLMAKFKTFERLVDVYLRSEGYKIIDVVEFKLKEKQEAYEK
jgi:hypothetical protein